MTTNPVGAAGLFLLARGRGGVNAKEDHAALTQLLIEFASTGALAACMRAKKLYRERHSGGCRMLSQGDLCDCFLCAIAAETKDIMDARDVCMATAQEKGT